MAKYVNLTKRPLPVTPSVGEPFIIPPKGTATLTGEQESSPSLVSLLSKGSLKRIADAEQEVFVPPVIPPIARIPIELPVLETETTKVIEEKEEEKPIKKASQDKGVKKPL